jgi:protein TonB
MRSWLLFITVAAGTTLLGQAPEAEKPYRVGGSVSRPRIVYSVNPEYTQKALDAHREGDVYLQLVVTRDGMPSEIHEILQPVGFGLDEKAVEAVQQWRFEPGKKGDQPVPVLWQVSVSFRLPR